MRSRVGYKLNALVAYSSGCGAKYLLISLIVKDAARSHLRYANVNVYIVPKTSRLLDWAAAQPGFDLGEGTAVMDPEIWNRGESRSPPLSPLSLE